MLAPQTQIRTSSGLPPWLEKPVSVGKGDVNVSFEFFPPRTEKGEEQFWGAVESLAALGPDFVSVTCGAGGTAQEKTKTGEYVAAIRDKTGIDAAAHLTCIGASRDEIDEIARQYWARGIRRIVALRGDPVEGIDAQYVPAANGYPYADSLVAGLKRIGDFDISVAGYPETHPQALSPEADIEHLKRKVDNGADRIITQFFIEPELFLRYRDKVAAAGINVPIVAGLLPIQNFAKITGFAEKCAATMPDWLHQGFAEAAEKGDTLSFSRKLICAQTVCFYREGIRNFHFYTLNKADLTQAACTVLGITGEKDRLERLP